MSAADYCFPRPPSCLCWFSQRIKLHVRWKWLFFTKQDFKHADRSVKECVYGLLFHLGSIQSHPHQCSWDRPWHTFAILFLGTVRVHSWRHPRSMPVWRDSHPSQRVCSHVQRHAEGWHTEQHLPAQRRVPGEDLFVMLSDGWRCVVS